MLDKLCSFNGTQSLYYQKRYIGPGNLKGCKIQPVKILLNINIFNDLKLDKDNKKNNNKLIFYISIYLKLFNQVSKCQIK